jgi:hypothetical protein
MQSNLIPCGMKCKKIPVKPIEELSQQNCKAGIITGLKKPANTANKTHQAG